VRRKLLDVHAATGSPIAKEALDRIRQLNRVEETISGALPDDRRPEANDNQKPTATALRAWAEQTAPKLSRKSRTRRLPLPASMLARRRPLLRRRSLGSTTIPPNAPCAAPPSAARITSSPVPMPVVVAPQQCTR